MVASVMQSAGGAVPENFMAVMAVRRSGVDQGRWLEFMYNWRISLWVQYHSFVTMCCRRDELLMCGWNSPHWACEPASQGAAAHASQHDQSALAHHCISAFGDQVHVWLQVHTLLVAGAKSATQDSETVGSMGASCRRGPEACRGGCRCVGSPQIVTRCRWRASPAPCRLSSVLSSQGACYAGGSAAAHLLDNAVDAVALLHANLKAKQTGPGTRWSDQMDPSQGFPGTLPQGFETGVG